MTFALYVPEPPVKLLITMVPLVLQFQDISKFTGGNVVVVVVVVVVQLTVIDLMVVLSVPSLALRATYQVVLVAPV